MREALADKPDPLGLQATDQLAVGRPVQPCGGVDAHDPQAAEVALVLLAVAVGVRTGVVHRVRGYPDTIFTLAEVPGCLADYFFAARSRRYACFGSWHGFLAPVFMFFYDNLQNSIVR
jgi:hypothetical protein